MSDYEYSDDGGAKWDIAAGVIAKGKEFAKNMAVDMVHHCV